MKNRLKRLLVTGASGLLGSRIVELAKDDFSVIPFHNIRPLHPSSIKVDIINASDVSNLFHRLEPDAVIHTASETNVDKCEINKEQAWKVNVFGTRNIAIACEDTNANLIYISTDYVFDGEKGNYKEEEETNPINHYGITKLEGEKQVIQNSKDCTILRTSVLYGWHPWKQNFATWVINSLRQKKEVTVVENHYNTPTLADNLAEIAIEVVQKNLRGIYHTSGSERVSRYELAKQIAKTFHLDQNLITPIRMNQLTAWIAKRPRDSSLDTSKIQKELETKPLNIAEGLNRMKREAET